MCRKGKISGYRCSVWVEYRALCCFFTWSYFKTMCLCAHTHRLLQEGNTRLWCWWLLEGEGEGGRWPALRTLWTCQSCTHYFQRQITKGFLGSFSGVHFHQAQKGPNYFPLLSRTDGKTATSHGHHLPWSSCGRETRGQNSLLPRGWGGCTRHPAALSQGLFAGNKQSRCYGLWDRQLWKQTTAPTAGGPSCPGL